MADNPNETAYLDLLHRALTQGAEKGDRTGTGTFSLFAPQLRINLQDGFPLLTTKKTNFRAAWAELRWMLRGDTNVKNLNSKIWNEWADENGDLGPVYGRQWRAFNSDRDSDQIRDVDRRLAERPEDRRMVVSAWNPEDLPNMALPPCHLLFQFVTHRDGDDVMLNTHVYQRSADLFLGVPFNIIGYSVLTHVMAERHGMTAGGVVFSYGDAHVYANHVDQVHKQLARSPYAPPEIVVEPEVREIDDLGDLQERHVGIRAYEHHPAIRAPVAV